MLSTRGSAPGHVLLVEIDAPGALPRVDSIAVARSRWRTHQVDLFEDADLDGLEAWLGALQEKSWTLVELSMSGQLSLAAHARLEALIEEWQSRLALLRVDANTVQVAPTAADLESLRGEGYLGRAIEVLRAAETDEDPD